MVSQLKTIGIGKILKNQGVPILRHPLTVVLVTAVLTSYILPILAQNSTLRQQRLSRALDILDHSMEVNRRLNNLITTLEIFHKDNSGVAARLSDYCQEQRELRKTMMTRYLEFDAVAWWWYGRIRTDAVILGLVSPAETERVRTVARQYEENLIESTSVLNALWNTFLRAEYDPKDEGNTATMIATRKKLDELYGAREHSVQALAELFASR